MAGKMRDFRQEIQEEHRAFSHARGMTADQRQLLDSVRKRNWVKVEKMLTRGVDVMMRDDTDTPLLHVVSQSNVNEDTITTMKTLLYFGADPDSTDRFGRTPLHLAVVSSSQLGKTLLEAGSSPNKQDNAGRSPLMEACGSESSDALVTVSMLIDSHCNVHLRDEMGYTALHCVCRNEKQDLVVRNEIALKLLLAGVSASVTDNTGKMAVCYELERFVNASQSQLFKDSRFLLVRTLVQAGSRFNARNKCHERWLKYVSLYSSVHVLRHLLNIAQPTLPLSVLKKLPSLTSEADGTAAENFHKDLRTLSRSVRSLQDLSRIVIREILKGKVLPSVSLLPLPQKIQIFVALQS